MREPEFYIDADLKTIGGIIVDSLRRDMGGDWVLSLPNSEKT